MDLTETLLLFVLLLKLTNGLRCYKCIAENDVYRVTPKCEHFDYSEKYENQCDASSMCYKRITTTQFGTTIYERGCAQQTMNGYQELRNGKWYQVKKINEVYEEGCAERPGNEERTTKTELCYCRGDLCNGVAMPTSNVLATLTTAILLVWRWDYVL